MSLTPITKLILTSDEEGCLRLSHGNDVNDTLRDLGIDQTETLITTFETEWAELIQNVCKYYFSKQALTHTQFSERFEMSEGKLIQFIQATIKEIDNDDTGHCVPRWLRNYVRANFAGTRANSKLWYS